MRELASPTAPVPASPEEQMRALADVFGEDWAGDFQDPVVFRFFSFHSPAAKQFYKREFPLISRTLFAESVYRRRPAYNQELLDAFVLTVARKLADVQAVIAVQCERLAKLCESNGQMTDAAFMHPHRVLVPIIAAHANSYLRCLLKLDELYQLSGSATLNGVIDGNQRKTVELLCRKGVRAFSAMLRNEIIKLRKESLRMRTSVGAPDPELERVEGAQEQAMQTFDLAVKEDEHIDAVPAIAAEAISASSIGSVHPRAGPRRSSARQPSVSATPGSPATINL